MERDRGMVVFGIFTLIVGLGAGYFMYAYPEGINPDWPMAMALLAPALFVMAGLHVLAAGLGQPRLADAMIRGIVLCLWTIINWAAFFTTQIQCVVTVSFLGVSIFGWQPSEEECRTSLRAMIAMIDVLIVMVVGAFAWQRYRARRT